MPSTYLTRTFGSPDDRRKFTLSMWVKIAERGTGNNNALLVCGSSGGDEATISFDSDYKLSWTEYNHSSTSNVAFLRTNRLFRDFNAWYHVVFTWDTTLGTADDRMKIYVNGVQETSFQSRTNPSQNYEAKLNTNITHNIGRQTWNSSGIFNGSMSHIHFVDGLALAPTVFGSIDATTGEWKIATSPTVSDYGTNGFFILKDGNSVTDQSGKGNNFTVGAGTLTKTEDNPSNVFATLNALDNYYPSSTFSHGNNSIVFHNGNECFNYSTLGMSSGKFYFEGKQISNGSAGNERNYFGITYSPPDAASDWLGNNSYSWGYRGDGKIYSGGSLVDTYSTFANNDIIGVALDMDNNKLYFSKNGTWQNSGDPTSGSTGTGAIAITADKTYFFAIGETTGGSGVESCVNFGNGYFKTTAVSSAGTNASGNGIFEYDVPTGFTALSTKGLNL